MITKEQLINEINHRFCIANGWDEELRTEEEKTALIDELLQNGESLPDENGLCVTVFYFDEYDKRNCGLYRIFEYSRPDYDEDGEPNGYIAVGWEIDAAPIE